MPKPIDVDIITAPGFHVVRPSCVYKRPATARAPPKMTPAGAMWFAAPVLVAATEADDSLEATELKTEEPADATELMTEVALEATEFSMETMLEPALPVAVNRAELRDTADELNPLRAELPTELMLEMPD